MSAVDISLLARIAVDRPERHWRHGQGPPELAPAIAALGPDVVSGLTTLDYAKQVKGRRLQRRRNGSDRGERP
jgi:hypothetical protein